MPASSLLCGLHELLEQTANRTLGNSSQRVLGDYPRLDSPEGPLWGFGSNARFFLAADVPVLANEILDRDALLEPTVLGYIYGGLATAGPPIGFTGTTIAPSPIFEVHYAPVPEPATAVLFGLAILCLSSYRCRTPA